MTNPQRVSFSSIGPCVISFDPLCDTITEPGCQQFSVNKAALNNGNATSGTGLKFTVAPDIEFLINDVVVYTLPSPVPNDATLHKAGFTFITKNLSSSPYASGTGLKLTIRNKAPGGNGNDFAVDNINFLPCGPKISFSGVNGSGCTVKNTANIGSFTQIIWQYTSDTNNLVSWKKIKFSDNQNPFTFTVSPIFSDTILGKVPPNYFVRAVAGDGNFIITNPKCRVNSNSKIVNCITPLPISFLSFTAQKVSDGVSLKWETTNELNNLKFIIERAGDDQKFVDIGSEDGRGNSTKRNAYYFKDISPVSGNNYYRLKQVDFDGKTEDSKIIIINIIGLVTMFPNPASRNLTIMFGENSSADKTANIRFVNAIGKVISEQNPTVSKNDNQIILENLPASNGVYYLEIIYQGTRTVKKIVINH